MNNNEAIMDKLTKICVCKGITRDKVKKAILDGASTVEEVNKATGCGSGSCKGKFCSEKIRKLL